MPQMFPIMWLILFIITNITLLIMSNVMFFMMKSPVSMKDQEISKMNHNWKW